MRRDNAGTWTIDDAPRMQAALARWLATGDGAKCAYAIGEFMHAHWPEISPPSWDRARREATDFADVIAAATTMIWCDPPMVDMWAAAADTYPDEILEPHHLPDPKDPAPEQVAGSAAGAARVIAPQSDRSLHSSAASTRP